MTTLLAWTVVFAIFMGLAAVAGWVMTKLKGDWPPMDSVDRGTIRDRFWKSPF